MSLHPITSDGVATLYQHHHGWLYNWLWRKVGCRDGAADLAHDTFIGLLGAQPQETLREPRAFLATIANRLLASHWRRLTLERAYLAALADMPQAYAPSPEERALTMEALHEVDAMLNRLPVKARQAFLLAQLDGMTYAAIAAQLQVSERMVKKYMAQAMYQCMLLDDAA